jgi:primosomal protein N' (replication factor Y)
VKFYAELWARRAEAVLPKTVELRGPTPPPLDKLKGYYRYQLWYFTDSIARLSPFLRQLREEFPLDKEVLEMIDVDPVDLS